MSNVGALSRAVGHAGIDGIHRREVSWGPADLGRRELWSTRLSDGDRDVLRDGSLVGVWDSAAHVCQALSLFLQRTLESMGLVLVTNAVDSSLPEDEVVRTLVYAVSDLGRVIPQTPHGALSEILRGDGTAELAFHTDSSDILVLLCLQPAVGGGGTTKLACARRVHDTIRGERPDLLAALREDWRFDRRGRPGAQMVVRPIFFTQADSTVGCYHSPRTARATPAAMGMQLTERQAEALDFLDEVLCRPEVECHLSMSKGDLLVVSNSRILHGRTAFVDSSDPAMTRRMLRLWLQQATEPGDPSNQMAALPADSRGHR